MVGPSSEAGYLNIGTAENSSHQEIEPEIEAVEATRDSDEVCGLERKECDEIMEHLKNNPGLVVKSLGPEGQIVLHVAVMAGETKKPEPPASKCTEKGFSEAADDSEWYRALKRKDCVALMALLEANPCLVAQTGPKGRTVLHAAARRGCLQLLDQVFDLFKDSDQFVHELSGVKVALKDLVEANYGPSEAKAHHVGWFAGLDLYRRLEERFKSTQRSSSNAPDASQHWRDRIVEIMQQEPAKKAFESLEEDYQSDPNYNFVLERKELQFHYACDWLYLDSAKNYVKTIIGGCLELGPTTSDEVLKYLLQLHNAQGQTPFHVAHDGLIYGVTEFLKLVPEAYRGCLNAKDGRGWTVLHCAAATGNHDVLEALLKEEQVDANARTMDESSLSGYRCGMMGWDLDLLNHQRKLYDILSGSRHQRGMTALHLAILHDDVKSVELLLKCPRTDVNALLLRDIVGGYKRIRTSDEQENLERRSCWSPLQLAAVMGLSDVVRALLTSKFHDIYDDGKFQNNRSACFKDFHKNFLKVSALLFASASGSPDTLRLFLAKPMFDPLVKFEGAIALHYATNAMTPIVQAKFGASKVSRCLLSTDLGHLHYKNCTYKEELEDMKSIPTSYLGRQACITMLLQAGVDIWEKDNSDRFAEPGLQAPEEALLWWHEKFARETLEAKKSLNDAANAISVVAALVATASFVGPLQPPLGYGGDSMEGGVQDTHLSIRVFMVSNILSFYLAVASIMFAVVPSLPMPQEGMYEEWQRTRRSVGVAIFFLLMSVLSVLISFGAASNSVVSEEYSWRHVGLSFYPTLVGGFICILGISLFFLRLLRLVFNRNAKIRYLYKIFVKF